MTWTIPIQYPRLVTPIRLMDSQGKVPKLNKAVELPLAQQGQRSNPRYREYNSTTNDSFTSCATSPRSGTCLNLPSSLSLLTSTQEGKPDCSASESASWIRPCFFAFSRTVITSPAFTSIDGMAAVLPLSAIAQCETSWRASARVEPNPMR